MPDGSFHHRPPALTPPEPKPVPAAVGSRHAAAALAALLLHAAVLAPLVWPGNQEPAAEIVTDLEIEPAPESAAPAAEPLEEPAPPLLAAAAAEPIAEPAPPELTAAAPPEPTPPTAPPEPPQVAEIPPEPIPPEPPPPEPAPLEQVQPEPEPEPAVEETALPLPPPPPPVAPPRPARPTPPRPQPARVATPAPAAAPPPAPVAAAPAPTRVAPPPSYVGALLAALERHKQYPTTARWHRIEGSALLRVAMRRDGSVSAWRLERSTGNADLDAAVGVMVRRASPLPAPPAELPGDLVELLVPVRFSLR
ncbi:hypothetical protein GCM10011504_13970 [Siccirubricoccus deserti]|uniref:TonB family protein n=1 Tax=Siccirubricoccus deserti TaxID=2013562 RepID=A0A9X0UG30_9PROT|nr:TonB family protein [Siccirubricoccus deserti]MBC4014950.1 TonB family protein [Siccirubricoccus deserti]GGC36822.1 hypothetical protein GCM10011504_13970 [Siccirubricoccus deserti]